jgi:hypothetical protein
MSLDSTAFHGCPEMIIKKRLTLSDRRRAQGSPRILRKDDRDANVRRAIVKLLGDGGAKIRKRDAMALVANAVAIAAKAITDPDVGIRPNEGIIDFLERSAKFADLSNEIPENIW